MESTSSANETLTDSTNDGTPIEFEFHSPDIQMPQDVWAYTQEKLTSRLRKYGRRIMGVVVHVRDVNGPKGGNGIVCHVEARLAGLEPCNVEEQEPDLRAALDVAIDRLDVVVGRSVSKARTLPRERGRKMVRNNKLAKE